MGTVIITGASTGIGRGTAQHFLAQGWNLVINSANEQNLEKVYQELDTPERIAKVPGDVSQKNTASRLLEVALEHFGEVNALINNAGVFGPKPFLDATEEDLDRFYGVNLKGTYFSSQEVIRQMLKQGNGGAVINIGTVLVDNAIAGFPASAAVVSKGAIHALTRQLAAEFGEHNIRVNTISPGIIRTPLQGKIGVEDADSLAGLHLLKRIGETPDIAEAAYYLATSNFVTGITFNIDGGHVAGHSF